MKLLKFVFCMVLLNIIIFTGVKENFAQTTDYLTWEEKTNVDPHHNWTVTFNQELDETTINDHNIYVQHHLNHVKIDEVSLLPDKKSIKIKAPVEGYLKSESYFLYIDNTVKTRNGNELKQPIQMKFTIGNEPTSIVSNLFIKGLTAYMTPEEVSQLIDYTLLKYNSARYSSYTYAVPNIYDLPAELTISYDYGYLSDVRYTLFQGGSINNDELQQKYTVLKAELSAYFGSEPLEEIEFADGYRASWETPNNISDRVWLSVSEGKIEL